MKPFLELELNRGVMKSQRIRDWWIKAGGIKKPESKEGE